MREVLVLDTSVVVKWYVPEEGSDAADIYLDQIVDGSIIVLAPDLMQYEFLSVMTKRLRRGELSEEDVRDHTKHFLSTPIEFISAHDILDEAFEISLEFHRSIYDACFVAVAKYVNTKFITADAVLVRALSKTKYGKLVKMLGE